MTESTESGTRIECPECAHGRLRVTDAIYADCGSCDAAVERQEVGI